VSYIQNARKLLADSKAGKNPYDGFTPSVSLLIYIFTPLTVAQISCLLWIYYGNT
jgi:hypothetical protein